MARVHLTNQQVYANLFRPRFELNVTIKYHKNLIVNFQLITQCLSGQGQHRRKFCHKLLQLGVIQSCLSISIELPLVLKTLCVSTDFYSGWQLFSLNSQLLFLSQLILYFAWSLVYSETSPCKTGIPFCKGFHHKAVHSTIQQFISLHHTQQAETHRQVTSDITVSKLLYWEMSN